MTGVETGSVRGTRKRLAAVVLIAALAVACGGSESGSKSESESESGSESGSSTSAGTARVPERTAAAEPVTDAVEAATEAMVTPSEPAASAVGSGETWEQHGGDAAEVRFSRLDQIDESNVDQLTLAWEFATGLDRGHEATPLVVNGRLYVTGSWSVLFVLDARTGRELWRYDPKVPRSYGQRACCDVVNRGVAYADGKIFLGSLDGRLIALDATDGALQWEVRTVDPERPYTITGAPRVVGKRVIIGNGGAEFGVRGYVSAYSTADGSLLWRTYTVPGDPSKPFESEALERAAETWKGGEWWKVGGGGTVWDSMAYDESLDLLYVGTGNGSPWTRQLRSPGGGDNLFLSSILALRPETGELVWHYQTTPGDSWDFTATQHMILTTLEIDGRSRRVIMQAPKNGFFYVLDRETGELISADKYVEVTWASEVDLATGRPVEVPGQDYSSGSAIVKPTPFGGHNWQPMSFNPTTGLVYIPAQEIMGAYRLDPGYRYEPEQFNTGTDLNVFSVASPADVSGHLLAWDPVAKREVWRQRHALPWNGGTLTTAGNLVFQGTADGRFASYRASDGEKLWEVIVPSGVIAAPMTYSIEGRQHVAIMTGFGGAYALAGGPAAQGAKISKSGVLRVYTLNRPDVSLELLAERLERTDPVSRGERVFHHYCARCHGAGAVSNDLLPDLRKMTPGTRNNFDAIVRDGIYASRGMPSFGEVLGDEQIKDLQLYLERRSTELD